MAVQQRRRVQVFEERDRNDFPICLHFGASALAFMILPAMILLKSDFAKSWRAKS